MQTETISPQNWRDFLARFSAQHASWLGSIRESSASGAPLPLRRLRQVDLLQEALRFEFEDGDAYFVQHPQSIQFLREESGAHAGLRVERQHGGTVELLFRVAVRPETINGLIA